MICVVLSFSSGFTCLCEWLFVSLGYDGLTHLLFSDEVDLLNRFRKNITTIHWQANVEKSLEVLKRSDEWKLLFAEIAEFPDPAGAKEKLGGLDVIPEASSCVAARHSGL